MSIRTKYPVGTLENYDCVCGPPPSNVSANLLDWVKYDRKQCQVCHSLGFFSFFPK